MQLRNVHPQLASAAGVKIEACRDLCRLPETPSTRSHGHARRHRGGPRPQQRRSGRAQAPAFERQEAPPATKAKGKKKTLTERRDTENKGRGLFATQSIEENAVVARQPPALSVVFDAHSQTVCGFCFKPDTTDKKTIKLVKRDGKVGVVFADDEHGAAVVTRLSATGANSTADIRQGGVLIGVHGALVATTGQALEALRNAPTAFEAVFIRPSLLICRDCGRFATCKDCAEQGRHKWHAHECSLFQNLPSSSKRADTCP